MQQPNIARLIEFQRLLLKFRAIERKLYLPPETNKLENDVEHSYVLAMMAWYVGSYFPELDNNLLIRLSGYAGKHYPI